MKMEKGSFHSIRNVEKSRLSLKVFTNQWLCHVPAQLLPKEIGSIFSNGSRNKKPFQSSKNDRNDNADALDDCTEERDAPIVSKRKGNKFRTLLRTSTGKRKQSRILFRNLSWLKFRFRMRVRFRFNNWKTNKADTGTDFEAAGCAAVKNAETGKMSKTISLASIKRPTGYCIIRNMKSIHKRMMKQGRGCKHENGDEQEKVELELCKKRILMGDKCRPLSASGSLHYDQNGILLPEVLPYQELKEF